MTIATHITMLKNIPVTLFTAALISGLASVTSLVQAQVEYGYSRTVRITAPAFKPMNDVEGTPYVPGDSTKLGWLVFNNKRVPVKLHYNSFTGEAEYMDNNRLLAAPDAVTEFVILSPDTLHFKKGFPTVGNWTTNSFYEVLYDGRKAKLVKHVSTSIKTNTDAMANDYGKKRFQQREEYYIWAATEKPPLENYAEKLSNGTMKSAATNKKVLVDIFPQDAERIDQFIASKKMKLKSWNDVASVLKYLDTQ